MTHQVALKKSGSANKSCQSRATLSLAEAIKAHKQSESASFHTPGHKGRGKALLGPGVNSAYEFDLTELGGLDELANAQGVLAQLAQSACRLWQSKCSFLSVNGASAALQAAVLAAAAASGNSRQQILLPRNCHRSAVDALVASGLTPIWFEPEYDNSWGLFTHVDAAKFESLIKAHASELAAAMFVSPVYCGALSDIACLAEICRRHGVISIFDEAHGAHFVPGSNPSLPPSAVQHADLVVHSLHKTLSAWTQTGLLHLGAESNLDPRLVANCLNALQSSSPSYLLLSSIEAAFDEISAADALSQVLDLSLSLRSQLSKLPAVQIFAPSDSSIGIDPLHILLRLKGMTSGQLSAALSAAGIYAEAELAEGVLLLLGLGTSAIDGDNLISALTDIAANSTGTCEASARQKPKHAEQVMSPRQAFFAASETVDISRAPGRVSAECFAPCPPGLPVLVPGQRISKESIEVCHLTEVRVVIESQN